MNRYDFKEWQEAGLNILTWYDPTYIDPSDLHAADDFGVSIPAIRPFLLVIDGNKQAFSTEDQRTKYLTWRIGLSQKRSK